MRLVLCLLIAFAAAACGSEIGDSCSVTLDCDPSNSKGWTCDMSSAGGYCTIVGCDNDSCPEGSVCIRFYVASFENSPCDPSTEDLTTDACSTDEVCSLKGQCVPQTSEIRYCMATCESSGDCRDEYECRDETLMREHGGEPVPPSGERLGTDLPSFCAEAPGA
jgi:hypothetical protein